MALNIGELVGYLKLDRTQWSAGITAAREQLRRLGAGNDNLNGLQSGVAKTAAGFVTLALRISALAGGLNLVVALTSAVMAMSGALPLAVAGGLALGAALITAKLGADGIKRAFEGLNPTLDGLKAKVSDSFERSLTPAVNNLKVALPQLTGGFQQIATAMGGVLTKITAWLKTPAAIGQVNTILSATSRVIQNIGSFLAPVIAAFVRIGAVAAPILVELTSGLGAVGERFKAWVDRMADSGNLTQWITAAIEAFRSLGAIIGDIGAILSAVFGALQDAGLGLGGTLGIVTGTIRAFVESAEGHDALVALAQAVGTVGAVVGQVLAAALRAIAPLLPPLLDAFSQLAMQVLPLVIGAISFLAPILLNIANFIQQNITWIGPLAIALGLWTAAQWLLNIALNANPIGLFILAVGALIAIVATIITYWGPITEFFSNLWSTVRDFFVNIWNEIWSFLTGVWRRISDTVSNVFGSIRDFFVNIWNSIVGFVRGAASNVSSAVSGGVSSAYNAVVDWLSRAVNWVAGLPGRILGALGNLGSLLWNAGSSIISGLLDGLKAAFQGVMDFVSGIAGWIANNKGPLSYDRTLLTPAGHAIMGGLHSGLVEGFEPVRAFIAQVGDAIASSLTVTAGTTGIAAAAQEILGQYARGGNVSEDFSFYGNSQNVRDYNDQISDMYRGGDVEQFLRDLISAQTAQQRATVQIENYHPPADASAADVASDLDWFSRAGG